MLSLLPTLGPICSCKRFLLLITPALAYLMEKGRPTKEEYPQWARDVLGVEFNETTARIFNQNTAIAQSTAQEHPFFKGIDEFIRNRDQEYSEGTGSLLLMDHNPVTLFKKPYDSAVSRSYRYNVVWNRRFDREPYDRWLTPENWFSRLDDVLRGTIRCKYMDGPGILAEYLTEFAKQFDLKSDYTSRQRDEGYYAYHFFVWIPVELISTRHESLTVDLSVELQLTTQLQEILYKITHPIYEEERDMFMADPSAWKWEASSKKFRAGYLSHTLHMLEAMILELRDDRPTGRAQSSEVRDE